MFDQARGRVDRSRCERRHRAPPRYWRCSATPALTSYDQDPANPARVPHVNRPRFDDNNEFCYLLLNPHHKMKTTLPLLIPILALAVAPGCSIPLGHTERALTDAHWYAACETGHPFWSGSDRDTYPAAVGDASTHDATNHHGTQTAAVLNHYWGQYRASRDDLTVYHARLHASPSRPPFNPRRDPRFTSPSTSSE